MDKFKQHREAFQEFATNLDSVIHTMKTRPADDTDAQFLTDLLVSTELIENSLDHLKEKVLMDMIDMTIEKTNS